ncbi:MAG: phosphatidate cytidylyltransferase [Anaerolineales bacterium]|nr:phosphatidate cytidylyltransferase [Anaerolineales bacterium]
MLRDRLVVILILIPAGMGVLLAGGPFFIGLVALLLSMAAWEYARLFSAPERPIPPAVLAAGCAALAVARGVFAFDHAGAVWTGVIFLSLIWFLLRFEFRGERQAATAMGITLGGTLYIGWLGSYLVSLRLLPSGYWWFLICLAAVGAADSSAYLVGRIWGRHPLARRISPKKTWEGYLGGAAGSTLAGFMIAWLVQAVAGTDGGITPAAGLLLGALIGLLSTLGDLGISMIKREMAQKDSGDFFPGHGGVLDRIDSWLVMAVVGYYTIVGLLPALGLR